MSIFWMLWQVAADLDKDDEEEEAILRKPPKRTPIRPKKGESKKSARKLFDEGPKNDQVENTASEDDELVAVEVAALRY